MYTFENLKEKKTVHKLKVNHDFLSMMNKPENNINKGTKFSIFSQKKKLEESEREKLKVCELKKKRERQKSTIENDDSFRFSKRENRNGGQYDAYSVATHRQRSMSASAETAKSYGRDQCAVL
jgi:hypothetical protein